MFHWHVSSCIGFVLTWRYKPVCAIVHGLPDCRAKAAFSRDMNRRFREDRHCGRMCDIWIIADLLRGPLR